jgi:hypothetical protein
MTACQQCGAELTGRADRKFCSEHCAQKAKRERGRVALEPRQCAACGASFTPLRTNGVFCSAACAKKGKKRNPTPVKAEAKAAPELIAYLLSDSISGPSIGAELKRLKENPRKLESALRAHIAALIGDGPALWPVDSIGRAAFVLFVLDHGGQFYFRRVHEVAAKERKASRFVPGLAKPR